MTTTSETPSRREALRWAIRNYYDTQKLRLAVGNRKPKKGGPPIELSPVDLEANEGLRDGLKALEEEAAGHIASIVREHPMWPWLRDIRGMGPTLSGVLLCEIDVRKARYASSVWKFAGLAVVDGAAPKPVKKQKLSYNKWLRSKVCGTLGPSILKASLRTRRPGEESPGLKWNAYAQIQFFAPLTKGKAKKLEEEGVFIAWEELTKDGKQVRIPYLPEPAIAYIHRDDRYAGIYVDRKHRAECSKWGKTHAHRHQHALRIMLKQLLADYWKERRTQLGLPTPAPYREAVLGMPPHGEEKT